MTAALLDNLSAHPDEGHFMTAALLDALLGDGEPLDDFVVDDDLRREAVPVLLAVGIFGLALFGLTVGAVAQYHGLAPGTPLVWVPVSLVVGFVTAIAIGLPSFYFYTQLAGLDASFRLVTAQALRKHARTSVLLLAMVPFYAAFALASVLDIAWIDAVMTAVTLGQPPETAALVVGFATPFLVGLAGMRSLYESFGRLVGRLPITHARRGNVLLRMLFMWGAVVSAIAPVAMYRTAEFLIAVT